MKRAIIVGFISGLVAGMVQAVLSISGIWDFFSVYYLIEPVSFQHTMLHYTILFGLWGIVYCVLYSFFYDYIPNKGIKKGIIFALIIWIAVAVHPALIIIGYGYPRHFIPLIFTNFLSTCGVYGTLIGILYKR